MAVLKRYLLLIVVQIFWASPVMANAKKTLYEIIDEDWRFTLSSEPIFSTVVGNADYNDHLPNVTVENLSRENAVREALLRRLEKVNQNKLSHQDRINQVMLIRKLKNAIQAYQFKTYLIPINADSGFHTELARLPSMVPLNNALDYKNYISRLEQFKRYMLEHIENMKTGLKLGITLPQIVLEGYENSIAAHVVERLEDSVFYRPVMAFPVGVSVTDRDHLKQAAGAAIETSVIPGYKALLDFMLNEYKPGARKTIAAYELPDGKAYYAFAIKAHTSLELVPEEIHVIGLREVARIRHEMDTIIKKLKFKGTFDEFLHFLRADQQFYAATADELLKEARDISKRMDAKLPSLFMTLPRTPYGVEAVPDEIAAKFTTGRYVGTSLGSVKPGYFWVNTYGLDKRPLYNLPALTLHEAVPGHHLQISLAKENQGIPNFRRHDYVTVFGEGWALYAEKLGVEAGIYRNEYEHFGRLSYEMWRACRLVVDTGLHAKAWTRDQARAYMSENTALSLHNINTETDRYIAWPAQALAYKLGELKILALRRKAETILGEHFDIREFHSAVLRNGGVPLDVLEMQIDHYISEKSEAFQ